MMQTLEIFCSANHQIQLLLLMGSLQLQILSLVQKIAQLRNLGMEY